MLSAILIAIRADVCCIAVLLLLYAKSFRTLGMSNNARFIRKILFVAGVYIAFYSLEELYMGGLLLPSRLPNALIIILVQLSQSILCYEWFVYTETIQNAPSVDKPWKRALLFLPVALFSIALLVSIKTNWIFVIRDDGSYRRGAGSWTQYAIIALYLLSATVKTFCKSLDKNNYAMRSQLRTLSGFIIAPVLATVYQYFSANTFMTGIGITISILALYISLQYDSVSLDDLTQINNRQQMLRFLSHQITNKSDSLYLLILDANKFKTINDTYGHVEGDRALIRIASALRSVAAQYHCFISRYGGDEFIVICEANSEQTVSALAADINREIQKINEDAGAAYPLSVSVGYAKYPDTPIAIPDFIQLADRQLYLVKQKAKTQR